MQSLAFTGSDYKDLFGTLLEAVDVASRTGQRPSISVNGRFYGDLLQVAALLPEDDLSPDHQAAVGRLFANKQSGYSRTGYNLIHLLNRSVAHLEMLQAFAPAAEPSEKGSYTKRRNCSATSTIRSQRRRTK